MADIDPQIAALDAEDLPITTAYRDALMGVSGIEVITTMSREIVLTFAKLEREIIDLRRNGSDGERRASGQVW